MHEQFMRAALEEARLALLKNEVPIGAVVVHEGIIIGRGHNMRNTNKNPLHHGEMIAINAAAAAIKDWRLEQCSIYVTIEPCPMCAGAIVTSRIQRVIFGARNPKAGCCGSILNLMEQERFNHRVEVIERVLEEECGQIMKDFFARLRNKGDC